MQIPPENQRLSTTGWVDAEVLEIEPPHRMVWSWSANDGNLPSTVTFQLTAEEGGTRLSLRQVGEFDPAIRGILREGWPGRLQAVAELLGRSAEPDAGSQLIQTRGGMLE